MKLIKGKIYLLRNKKTDELYLIKIVDDKQIPMIKMVYDLKNKTTFRGQCFPITEDGDEFIEIMDIEDIIHLLI